MGSYFHINMKSDWLQHVQTPVADERFIKEEGQGKSKFWFHSVTVVHVGGHGSEDNFYTHIMRVCLWVCEEGKEKKRGVAFEDVPRMTPLSSLDADCLLFQ